MGALVRRTDVKKLLPLVIIIILALVLALTCSGLSLLPWGTEQMRLSIDDAAIDGAQLTGDGAAVIQVEDVYTVHDTGKQASFTFKGLDMSSKTFGLVLMGPHTTLVEATLYKASYTPEGARQLTFLDSAYLNPAWENNAAVLRMYDQAGVGEVQLTLSRYYASFYLAEVNVNQSGFSYNFRLAFLLVAIGAIGWLIWQKKWHSVIYDCARWQHRAILWVMALLGVIWSLWLLSNVNGQGSPYLLTYTPNDPGIVFGTDGVRTTYYHHLFDAFLHGQTSLRYIVPDAAILAAENPYDPAQLVGLDYPLDLSLHNGRYYLYFGPAPMVLHYITYFLFGKLPSYALTGAVGVIFTILFSLGALNELLRYFKIKANLLLTALAFPAMLFGSLLFVVQSYSEIYELPYIWALMGFAGFVWLYYLALRSKRPIARQALFFASGICVVDVAASRPMVLLLCVAFALPAALRYVRQREVRWYQKAADAGCLLLPIAAGAILLGYYNHVRFGSPFLFGNTLQLTVTDMSTQTLRFSPVWFFQAWYIYLCTPLRLVPQFPYVRTGVPDAPNYGSYFFNLNAIGLANMPLFWGLAPTVKVLRKQSAVKKATYLSVLAVALLVIWIDYCLANVMFRYILDVSLALGILAVLVLVEFVSRTTPSQRPLLYTLTILALAVTFFVGFFLCFLDNYNFMIRISPDAVISMSKRFNIS